jgi:hypothetical protein
MPTLLPFASGSVDCVLSVYHFEHVRRLATAWRRSTSLKPEVNFLVGIPLEGRMAGMESGGGSRVRRYMEKKYGIDYHAVVRWEHWNDFPR